MHALILPILLLTLAADDDVLLRELQTEFNTLAEADASAAELRQAEKLLQETDQSAHWTNYSQATAILRKAKSKAAVPLLLQYMVRDAELSTAHVTIDEYADTISVLTGEKIESPYTAGPNLPQRVRQKVDSLYRQWWLKRKAELLGEASEMTRAQLEVVVEELLKKSDWDNRYVGSGGGKETAYRVYHALYYDVMNPSSSSESPWQPDGLRGEMLPILLQKAGYRAAGEAAAGEPLVEVPYPVVQLLAELRKNQQAPDLEKIAADADQPSVARLTSILALYAAGEDLDTQSLLAILDREKRLELRLVTIIALVRSRDREQVPSRLIALMDDRNAEIQTAAVCALFGSKPPAALPRLKRMIDELHPHPAMTWAFDLIGEIGTQEAKQALADFIETGLEDPQKREYVSEALGAFATATGERFYDAGAHDEAYYLQKALEALIWWKAQQERSLVLTSENLQRIEKVIDRDNDGQIELKRISYHSDSQPVLICATRFVEGTPKTVTNTIFHNGVKVCLEIATGDDPPSFSTRSFTASSAAVGMYNEVDLAAQYIVLLNPAGESIAAFRRTSDGTLQPTGKEEFERISHRYHTAQSDAEKIDLGQ